MVSKVLTFEKNSTFYYNRYEKAFDKGDMIQALVSIRSAIEKEPDNAEFRFNLAEILTEMELFEEANYELIKLLTDGKTLEGNVIFAIGANLFNLGDYEKAQETFQNYLNQYPSGAYIADAAQTCEIISEILAETPPIKDAALEVANHGKQLLDSGEFTQAIQVMEPLAKKNPRASFLQNNLSLAYFCVGDTDKAISLSKRMLEYQPKNIHTICNLAIFHSTFDKDEAIRYCELLNDITTDEPADLSKMLLTFCEVGLHERAYDTAKQMLLISPYEKWLLFIYASACANTGRLGEALNTYLKILHINPEDTITQYYKSEVQKAYEKNPTMVIPLQYIYQVPFSEIQRRLSYLHEQSSIGERNMRMLWETDDTFTNLVIWGLYFSDFDIKKVCGEIICAFYDKKAENVLRKYLMDSNEPDVIKNDILITMEHFGYKQPFIANMNGKLAEVHVSNMNYPYISLPSIKELLDLIADYEPCRKDKQLFITILEFIDMYYKSPDATARFVNKPAWAAAFSFYVINHVYDMPLLLGDVCQDFSANEASVKRCLTLIEKIIGETNERH